MNANRKGSTPTQTECRPTTSKPTQRAKKSESILHRFMENFKTLSEKEKAVAIVTLMFYAFVFYIFVLLAVGAIVPYFNKDNGTEPTPHVVEKSPVRTFSNEETVQKEEPAPIFTDNEGTKIDLEAMTKAWAAEAGFRKRYELTDAERWEVASVVTSEARGEPFAGKVAVAQCILQAAEDEGIRPPEVFTVYKYTKHRPEPTEEALEAVQAVFDFGHVATAEPIKYFYNPNTAKSKWHESQDHVLTINNHRFFKEATK